MNDYLFPERNPRDFNGCKIEASINPSTAVFLADGLPEGHITADAADEIADHLKLLAQEWRDKQPKPRYYRNGGSSTYDRLQMDSYSLTGHRFVAAYLTDEEVAFLNAGAAL